MDSKATTINNLYVSLLRIFTMTVLVCSAKDACSALYSTQAGAKAVEQHHSRGKAVTLKPWQAMQHRNPHFTLDIVSICTSCWPDLDHGPNIYPESQALPRERIEAILERRVMI